MIQRFIEDLDRGVAWGFEGVRTERKIGPPKVLETRWSGGHVLQENFSYLGAQKWYFLRFPQNIFSK